MLIKCPECGKDISDKAQQCIYCGYPLNENISTNIFCEINGSNYNLENALELYLKGKAVDSYLNIKNTTKLSLKNTMNLYEEMSYTNEIPQYYNPINYTKGEEEIAFKQLHELKKGNLNITKQTITSNPNIPTCPKCGSTAITAGQRGYSVWTGFLGSGKTVNRCANCGHSWTPGK